MNEIVTPLRSRLKRSSRLFSHRALSDTACAAAEPASFGAPDLDLPECG
jgi:hypothetical protein